MFLCRECRYVFYRLKRQLKHDDSFLRIPLVLYSVFFLSFFSILFRLEQFLFAERTKASNDGGRQETEKRTHTVSLVGNNSLLFRLFHIYKTYCI